MTVPYGGEDSRNYVPLWSEQQIRCYCGAREDLRLVGQWFYCRRCR